MSRSIASIAAQIPAEAAQLALATIMAAMGREFDYDSDLWGKVAPPVMRIAEMAGLPPVGDQDDQAHAFWASVIT